MAMKKRHAKGPSLASAALTSALLGGGSIGASLSPIALLPGLLGALVSGALGLFGGGGSGSLSGLVTSTGFEIFPLPGVSDSIGWLFNEGVANAISSIGGSAGSSLGLSASIVPGTFPGSILVSIPTSFSGSDSLVNSGVNSLAPSIGTIANSIINLF